MFFSFSILPAVNGSFSWFGNQLVFIAGTNFDSLATYQVSISTGAKDAAGNNLASLYTWSFTTGVLSPDLPEVKGENEVLVYPNPYIKGKASSNKITFLNLGKEAIIKIYNTGGEFIKELSSNSDGKAEWDVSDVSGGVYLYVISSSEGVKKGKVSIIK